VLSSIGIWWRWLIIKCRWHQKFISIIRTCFLLAHLIDSKLQIQIINIIFVVIFELFHLFHPVRVLLLQLFSRRHILYWLVSALNLGQAISLYWRLNLLENYSMFSFSSFARPDCCWKWRAKLCVSINNFGGRHNNVHGVVLINTVSLGDWVFLQVRKRVQRCVLHWLFIKRAATLPRAVLQGAALLIEINLKFLLWKIFKQRISL